MTPLSLGVYGGTFNPIHYGHVRLALHVQKALGLDRVLIIPANIPPHKRTRDLLSGEERLALCRLACAPYPQLEVSSMELTREGNSYTVDTLTALKERYPHSSLTLIVGSDMFLTMESWRRSGDIFQLARICTGAREEGIYSRLLEKKKELSKLGAVSQVLDLPVFDISSTQIRRAAALGADRSVLSRWMGTEEAGYLLDHRCYSDIQLEEDPDCIRYLPMLKEKLSPRRYFHSRCVADAAQELAESIFSGQADAKKARLAGLLHDICKGSPKEEQLELIRREGLEIDPLVFHYPSLWHGFAGAAYLREKFGFEDEDFLNAIRYHTTARRDMSPLEQAVYLADYISLDRDYPDVNEMRAACRVSAREGMTYSLKYTVGMLAEKGMTIDRYTWEAYNQTVWPEGFGSG